MMRGMNRRTLLFMVVLGLIVFSVRGSGLEMKRWEPGLMVLGVIVATVVTQWIHQRITSRRRGDREDDAP